MLDLKRITIKDRKPFLDLLKQTEFENSEFSFANIFIWQDSFDIKLCIQEDVIYISSTIPETGRYVHFQPICTDKTNIDTVYHNIKEDIKRHGEKFCIASVNESCVQIARVSFPEVRIEEIPDMFDYVYLTEDLSELEGKKYHKKRTHVNKFERENSYTYVKIDDSNKSDCMKITDMWIESMGEDPYKERKAIQHALEYMEELEVFGAILYIDGEPAAFTMAEFMKDDMALILFEKAVFEHRGAYPVINQQFAKRELLGKCTYINREEDMGIEGLKKAKSSYHPCKMVKKYDIFEK